jgi:hypothetical protein
MSTFEIDYISNIIKKDGVEIDPKTINLEDEYGSTWLHQQKVIKSKQGRPSGEYYRALNFFEIKQIQKEVKPETLSVNEVKTSLPKTPKAKKPTIDTRPCVEYTPQHSYLFKIVDDVAHLWVDDVEFNITEETVLNIDPMELYFGILPAVVDHVHTFMDKEKFLEIPPIFAKRWGPKIFTDGTRSTIGHSTISFLILILFFKRVVRSEFVYRTGITFFLSPSKDIAHCYRSHTDKTLFYILQNSANTFKSHGYTGTYTDGSYVLYSLTDPRPVVIADRSAKISEENFKIIKAAYNFCCALCGNLESDAVKLEQGHIDPHFPLSAPGNCAPHCSSCNQTNKNNMSIREFVNPLGKRKLAYFAQHVYIKSLYTPEEFLAQQKKDFAKIFPDYKIDEVKETHDN